MKMPLRCSLFCIILILVGPLRAQWAKAYGREFGSFNPAVIHPTSDGGYIACGDFGDTRDQSDPQSWGWALKLSADGAVEWIRTYSQLLFSITPTTDGGYAACGWFGIYKLDLMGYVEWKIELDNTYCWSIQQTQDQGYIIAADRGGGLAYGEQGSRILKLTSSGSIEWSREFAIGDQGIIAIKQTPDSGFAAIGNTRFRKDGRDFWLMKISPQGRIVWEKVFGGQVAHRVEDFDVTSEGIFLVAGIWADYSQELTQKIWIMRISPAGQIISQKYLAGEHNPFFKQIRTTWDKGSILVSLASVPDFDFHILKLDDKENIQWERTFGGRQSESAWSEDRVYSVCQAGDGSFTVLGSTDNLGFIPEPSGRSHTFLVVLNLSEQGDYPGCPYLDFTARTTSQSTNYFFNPLTFGFRDWKLRFIDTKLEVGEFSLTTVENLCDWVSNENSEIKRTKKRTGGIR